MTVWLVKLIWDDSIDLEKIFDSEEKALKYILSEGFTTTKASYVIEERIVE